MIRLMIADDHCMVREGLKQLFELDHNIQVAAEAGSGIECLNLLQKISFDILILNLDMPDGNAFDVLKKIDERGKRNFKILILTGHSEIHYFLKASKYGVEGYVLKKSKFSELKNAVYMLMSGNLYIQEEMKTNPENMKTEKIDSERILSLTNRELDILKDLSTGMYNKEIALKLDISERTVKNHISSIFKKIGVADRTQAAVFSIRNNLIDIYHR